MKALITIHYKQGILDPQGKAALHAMQALDVKGVGSARVGKHIVLEFDGLSADEVKVETRKACDKLLANPVIEDYEFELTGEQS